MLVKKSWNLHEKVTLVGSMIRLEPLKMEHAAELTKVGLDPELWKWTPNPVTNGEEMVRYVQIALDEHHRGLALPFVIVTQTNNEIIGSTRFGNIEPLHRHLEIGWTWITPTFQRTCVNTETKLLLLSHAFDVLGANRVEFKTDSLNHKSRNAVLRLGAMQEGVLRQHMITASAASTRYRVFFHYHF